jgi:hypothetical protein
VLRLHYAQTLAHWYERTTAAQREIEALYDARFFRMWQFYLAGAIAAFRHDGHCNFQFQLARRRDAVPLTRDYIALAEARFLQPIDADVLTLEPSRTPPSNHHNSWAMTDRNPACSERK